MSLERAAQKETPEGKLFKGAASWLNFQGRSKNWWSADTEVDTYQLVEEGSSEVGRGRKRRTGKSSGVPTKRTGPPAPHDLEGQVIGRGKLGVDCCVSSEGPELHRCHSGKSRTVGLHRRSERGPLWRFRGASAVRGSQLLQRSTRCRRAPESSNVDSCVGEGLPRSASQLFLVAILRNSAKWIGYKNSWKWPARAWTVQTNEKA